MNTTDKIYVAGHRGVVGKALVRALSNKGFVDLVLRTRDEVDLNSSAEVRKFLDDTHPRYMLIAAAKVGGIAANIAAPVDFLVENIQIQNNLLLAAHEFGVSKTLFLGSSCVYPRESPQPMREEYLLTGPLEPTNETYAIAKIAGIRLAQALAVQFGTTVVSAMPSNVYGPGDHWSFERSHVVSALVRRFCEAKAGGDSSVTLWGTGNARRELLHVDDLAQACLFLMAKYDSSEIINVGTGLDHSISELAETVRRLVGYRGKIAWDTSKPDGMPQKLLDVSRIRSLGWRHKIDLEEGLGTVIGDFYENYPDMIR